MGDSFNSRRGVRHSHNRHREYWSRRLRGMYPIGRFAKWLTHRKERAEARRIERAARDGCAAYLGRERPDAER